MSTLTKVGIGVLAVGAGVGVAAAVDDDSSSHHSSAPAEELTQQTILGTWSLNNSHTDGRTSTGQITFNNDGSMLARFIGTDYDYEAEGTWTLNGSQLTLHFDAGALYEGQASGDSKNFTLVATNNGWTLNFSR
jgi:hypothetical protein